MFLIASCSHKENQPAQTAEKITINENKVVLTEAQYKSASIELSKPTLKSISSIIKLTGKIDVPPQNMVSVSMPLGGYLKSTNLLPGMHVNKGEVIATLEDQQYIQLQQDYLTCKSKLKYAEGEYLRQKELNASKASSDKVFQQAEMEFSNQKITLTALSEKLKLININPSSLTASTISKSIHLYATINGFVSRVNVNIGKYVNASDVLFELVNPDDIHLNIKVFERDLDKLSIGQSVITYSNNAASKKHLCKIILISKDLTAERTADVHCHFEDYDKTLLPGMYMNAEVNVASNNSLTIAEEAIVNFEGKDYVFVATANRQFEMKEVQTGIKEKGFIELINATAIANMPVVIKGAYTLLMALKNKSEE